MWKIIDVIQIIGVVFLIMFIVSLPLAVLVGKILRYCGRHDGN